MDLYGDVGAAFLIPTATNELLGTKKFGIGPTAIALKQTERLDLRCFGKSNLVGCRR